jgi:hypothetical protein
MVTQITPTGNAPLPSAGSVAAPIAVRSAPAQLQAGPALGSKGQDAAVAQVNQHLQQAQTELTLQVDAGSGRTVFRVIQQGTGELVLQVPSAEVLGMSRRIRNMAGQTGASGALVDKEG